MGKLSVWIMAAGYVFTGVAHFTHTADFVKIVPPYLPFHLALVYISGFFEITLALAALFKGTRQWACYGIIALLIAVLPANIYMLTNGAVSTLPHWILMVRIPFQAVLIAWAFLNSRVKA